MTPPPPSRIRLCGALEVEIEGTRIEPRLRGTQGRLLLAYLVLNRERPVLRRELEGALWEGRRPAASDALSPSLSRLRQAVGAERLPGRDHLQLRLGNAPVVDVEVARGQVEDGRMALAADDVRAARASALRADATLGQGLLPGLEAGWLAHHREQSRELRLDALEIVAVAGMRLGRDALPAAEQAARAAVELAPLRESARVVLLDVLAARGNVAEALVEFERARTLLRDRLGSVPGPELRAAHGDLLRRSSRAADSSAARLGAAGAAGASARPWPRPLTPMIGREREIDAVGGLLLREDVRLLTLSGPGGIGKTRLALEAGDRVAEHFDGVRFVGLAQTSDPEAVAETLASDLGLRSSGARSALEELQAHLGSRRMLLLLDNFEQVADAAPVVAELLAAAPGVTALITSRTVLRVSGEHHYAVPALPLPATRFVVDARSAEAFDGIELFVRRVQAGTPAFRLTDANAATVAEICRRLDGLPLAIELAAARVALMTPEALLERLGNRLDLLTSGPRDAPGRHRTLRDTIAWSYELLEPAERELLERLGSFAGSFDVDGAEAIDGRGAATVELLGALVDDSLVQREASRFGVRFALLATIRDFARERARESGREIAAAERHARYHLAVAERAEPLLRGPSQAEWLDRLSADHENLRAAMSWFLGADDVESAVRLGWAVWMYWWLTGHVDDAARWADAMVERSDGVDRHLQARALQGAAFQLLNAGDFAAARELLERSRRDFVHVADRPGVARSGTALGFLAVLRGDLDQAEALLDESIGHFRDLGDDWFLAVTLGYRGLVPLARGELDGAAGVFREALAVSRVVGDTLPLLISSCNLAVSEARRGALATAGRHYADALAVAAAAGDAGSVGFVLRGLASLAAANDEREHAVLVSAAADALCESAGGAWLETHAAPRLIGDAEDATLDVAVLTEAQERGRQLSMDQAVEVALAGAARRDPA